MCVFYYFFSKPNPFVRHRETKKKQPSLFSLISHYHLLRSTLYFIIYWNLVATSFFFVFVIAFYFSFILYICVLCSGRVRTWCNHWHSNLCVAQFYLLSSCNISICFLRSTFVSMSFLVASPDYKRILIHRIFFFLFFSFSCSASTSSSSYFIFIVCALPSSLFFSLSFTWQQFTFQFPMFQRIYLRIQTQTGSIWLWPLYLQAKKRCDKQSKRYCSIRNVVLSVFYWW